jgi:hypothetical protein
MDPNENQEDTSVLDVLVGEGKKYKSVADLAKGYAHADVFIEQVKLENSTYKQKVEQMEAQLEILSKLATNPKAEDTGSQTPAGGTEATPPPQVDDIEAKIRSTVEQLSEETKRKQNTAKVDEALLEKFGESEKATQFLKEKAEQLGLGVKFLTDLAATSPNAFYATVGLDVSSQPKGDPAPRSTVNTATMQSAQAKPGTYAYYQALRRDNKSLYNSAKIQMQMHEDAKKPGFFG